MSIKGAIASATALNDELVATVEALYWKSGGDWQRLAWYEIARATWNSESGDFVVTPVASPTLEWKITEPGRLPETARERITSTIVAQDQVTVAGLGAITIIFRQVDGQILAQTLPPVEPSLVAGAIAQVKAELGLG